MANVDEFPRGLNFWGPHLSSERERKIRRRVPTSSIQRRLRKFDVEVLQYRMEMYQKGGACAKLMP